MYDSCSKTGVNKMFFVVVVLFLNSTFIQQRHNKLYISVEKKVTVKTDRLKQNRFLF